MSVEENKKAGQVGLYKIRGLNLSPVKYVHAKGNVLDQRKLRAVEGCLSICCDERDIGQARKESGGVYINYGFLENIMSSAVARLWSPPPRLKDCPIQRVSRHRVLVR